MTHQHDSPVTGHLRPIMFVSDPSSLANNYLPDPVVEDDLRRIIDGTAEAGIDIYCQDMYSQCSTAYWRDDGFAYDARPQHERFVPMLDRGVQPAAVLVEQCHRRGMKFFAGIRVNDNHGYKQLAGYPWVGGPIHEMIEAHPDWELTDRDPEWGTDDNYALDFSVEGVRQYTADVICRIIDRFDLDGVELCFRDHGYFPFGQAPQRAHLMTDVFRALRAHIDAKSKAVGRELLLGARVGWPLPGCREMGLDVPRWVEDGLIDYLAPMDDMWADANFPLGPFAALTKDRPCRLWPGLLPWSSQRSRIRNRARPTSDATNRACAHSLYRQGADSVSLFNFCTVNRCHPYFPQQLQVCHTLKDPQRLASLPRHYVYEPMWASLKELDEARTMRRYGRADHIVLERGADRPAGQVVLDLYEEPDQAQAMQLLLRGRGLVETDELEVTFNGRPIADRDIERSRRSDAHVDTLVHPRVATDGRRWRCNREIRPDHSPDDPPSSARWFRLDPSWIVEGGNTLSVRLLEGDPQCAGEIVIDEFEIWVQPK